MYRLDCMAQDYHICTGAKVNRANASATQLEIVNKMIILTVDIHALANNGNGEVIAANHYHYRANLGAATTVDGKARQRDC